MATYVIVVDDGLGERYAANSDECTTDCAKARKINSLSDALGFSRQFARDHGVKTLLKMVSAA